MNHQKKCKLAENRQTVRISCVEFVDKMKESSVGGGGGRGRGRVRIAWTDQEL